MNAHPVLLQKKYARIITLYAKKNNIELEEGLRKFYHSTVYKLMRTGTSNMHCMSDDYLIQELEAE